MEKEILLDKLNNYHDRLTSDVRKELNKNYEMGNARWGSWCMSAQQFFEQNLPQYLNKLKAKTNAPLSLVLRGRSRAEILDIQAITPVEAFLKSLILDINVDDYINSIPSANMYSKQKNNTFERKAFIVHGHDVATKERTARFLEKLGFVAVILHEQVNGGKTIIEKLEHFTDVGFSIVLYTPDDVGEAIANQTNLKPRARQNVVFEHGLLIGKLGRERVFPLVTDQNVELPGDISGVVYLSDNGWEFQLAKEIKALGYEIDFNKLI